MTDTLSCLSTALSCLHSWKSKKDLCNFVTTDLRMSFVSTSWQMWSCFHCLGWLHFVVVVADHDQQPVQFVKSPSEDVLSYGKVVTLNG